MTLTELKYVVAVARERHFGRAAEACFVSQPTLSVGIKKLENELGVTIFERGGGEITVTPVGERIVAQAQGVLEQADAIHATAQGGANPLRGPLRLGVIPTIGPYLLPYLVPTMISSTPGMPLILEESFTVVLLERLRRGEIDVAILAEPFAERGLVIRALYDEPFVVAVPRNHAWADRNSISSIELKGENMLLLGQGHCFRDQVLEVCPEMSKFAQASGGIQRTFEGSSLETIRHMVASGIGITVLPVMAVPAEREDDLLSYVPFVAPVPVRRVVLAWRKGFPRTEAIEALYDALRHLAIPAVKMCADDQPVEHG